MILIETVSKPVRAQCDGGNLSSSAMSITNECMRVRCLVMGAPEARGTVGGGQGLAGAR
jgi:hypothetical protein